MHRNVNTYFIQIIYFLIYFLHKVIIIYSNNLKNFSIQLINETSGIYRKRTAEDIHITAGNNNLLAATTKYLIEKIVLHLKWNPITGENDVALLKVATFITFQQGKIQPISISTLFTGRGKSVLVHGWGLIDPEKEIISEDLLRLQQTTVSNRECAIYMDRFKEITRNRIYKTNICTSSAQGTGNCKGDSGGPLVRNGKLIGIVSYGKGNCAMGTLQIYTRLALYTSWLKKVIYGF